MKNQMRGKRSWRVLIGILAGVLCLGAMSGCGKDNSLLAVIIRLLRLEGTVSLEDASGKVLSLLDGMKLYDGNVLTTGNDGLAELGLDDAKIVTLNTDSKMQFHKEENAMSCYLEAGELMFNVTEPVPEGQTFDIQTSTMVVGIRGTVGVVRAVTLTDEEKKEFEELGYVPKAELQLLEGTTDVTYVNVNTGEKETVSISSGQSVTVFEPRSINVPPITTNPGSVSMKLDISPSLILTSDLQPEDLSGMVLETVTNNPNTLDRVEKAGWMRKGDSLSKLFSEPVIPSPEHYRIRFEDLIKANLVTPSADTKTEEEKEPSTTSTEVKEEADTNQQGNGQADTTQQGNGQADTTQQGNGQAGTTQQGTGQTGTTAEPESNLPEGVSYIDENGIYHLTNGNTFDPELYASLYYDDVVKEYGTDPDALYDHYLHYGMNEGRIANQAELEAAQKAEEQRKWEEKVKQNAEENDEIWESGHWYDDEDESTTYTLTIVVYDQTGDFEAPIDTLYMTCSSSTVSKSEVESYIYSYYNGVYPQCEAQGNEDTIDVSSNPTVTVYVYNGV